MEKDDVQVVSVDKAAITEEVRKEMNANQYNEKTLNFDSISLCVNEENQYCYNEKEFEEHIKRLNILYNISKKHESHTGNVVKKFIQNFIKRLVRFYIEPVVDEQVRYNAEATRALNQIQLYHQQSQQDIDEINLLHRTTTYEMMKKLQSLEYELMMVKQQLEQYKEKVEIDDSYKEENK